MSSATAIHRVKGVVTVAMPPAPPEALFMVTSLRWHDPKFRPEGVTWQQLQRTGARFRSAQGLWQVTDCASQCITAIPLDGPHDPAARSVRPYPVREQVFCISTFHLLTLEPETAPAAKPKPNARRVRA
jgi:hypothetical protein